MLLVGELQGQADRAEYLAIDSEPPGLWRWRSQNIKESSRIFSRQGAVLDRLFQIREFEIVKPA
jgi:hypothetical protein